MTTAEKIYNSFVLTLGIFFILSMAAQYYFLAPMSDNPGVHYFMLVVDCILACIFLITSIINFIKKSLLFIPTFLQILFGFLSGFGIPFSIMGIILLRKNKKRKNSAVLPLEGKLDKGEILTGEEKVYNSFILSLAIFFMFSMAASLILIAPKAEHPNAVYMSSSILLVFLLVFFITSFANILKKKLLFIPTILQIIFCFFTVLGIPFSVIGIILLRKKKKRQNI